MKRMEFQRNVENKIPEIAAGLFGANQIVEALPVFHRPWSQYSISLVQAISHLDEMERQIQMDGTAFSYLVTILLVLTMGMLGIAVLPKLNGTYIATIMLLLWLVEKLLGNRRYQ